MIRTSVEEFIATEVRQHFAQPKKVSLGPGLTTLVLRLDVDFVLVRVLVSLVRQDLHPELRLISEIRSRGLEVRTIF